MLTTDQKRRFYNPVQKDYVTFLETSRESRGKRTRGLLEVAPGGRVNPHYHLTFSETFIVRSGTLQLRRGKERLVLQPGESATVPAGVVHAWSNASKELLVCEVVIAPGNGGFEKALQAGYGLAMDGLVQANGTPKSFWHLVLLVELSETKLAGPVSLLNGLFGRLARIARRLGKDKELEKYFTLE